jgi:hypothetical protein
MLPDLALRATIDPARASVHSGLASGFPGREIPPKDEEFPPDLHDRNAIFLNDSAEMTQGKACHTGGCGNVQKHLGTLWRKIRCSVTRLTQHSPGSS